ncbi:MAG: WbqC family protein [Rickettsia endosymbiont of Ixodes persulcatus]|nr:WbqC family protein [Rickettsia endosymbiont of Ixodes persulcatus]MCZ6914578.1 WbqC family protein [Rickettsia endosymbiont of Ixodes persulcatus]
MDKVIAISQPMFFPWIGLFEQIYYSDIFVHLVNVQIPGGQSFIHRVQLKGPSGVFWWSVPTRKKFPTDINAVILQYNKIWLDKSLKRLEIFFYALPFKDDVLLLVKDIFDQKFTFLHELNIYSLEKISEYIGLNTVFKLEPKVKATDPTDRLVKIIKYFSGGKYITGLGGKNYLMYEKFKKENIKVSYMDYSFKEYYQKFGLFNPYVSILHLLASVGKDTKKYFASKLSTDIL